MALRVWAPDAKQVELETGGKRSAMTETGGGWWQAQAELPVGTDYAFCLDGGPPRPDPRSHSQPRGIHGPSRIIDQSSFKWDDARWQSPPLPSAVVYELHVGTYTSEATFEAVIDKLPHLVRLGVTHVELMPVHEFPGKRGWGYDSVDIYAAHHGYGGPEGLKRLVAACHRAGLAVLIDVVYNHLGPAGNYLEEFGPYFSERHFTPWGKAVNFDGPRSDDVRRFFIDNALMWLRDYHADGLRLDAIHAIVDTSAIPFLQQLATEVSALSAHLGRHLVLIAESDLNDPRVVRNREAGGFGYDAQWSDDFHHALHTALTGERDGYYADFGTISDLATALRQSFVYAGRYSAFRRRQHGQAIRGLSGHRFLGYLQNHDQSGNRARGDRSSHLMSRGRLKVGAALVLTSPFVPMLFQGEEWGTTSPFQFFTDFEEPELAQAVREGRRREFVAFGWSPEEIPDPQDPGTFENSKLKWDELNSPPHAELLDWHTKLIALRRRESCLTDGRLEEVGVDFDEQARWLVVERGGITVACNLADRRQLVPIGSHRPRSLRLASEPQIEIRETGIELPPDSVAILGV
ncbi:MAG TPA: malto-oligosyltrehalose trehalohydrolase [Pirellulales bacterium]|nr:malto-oligosyltrehalose trehalohydrolase [Pirellulales bacterium]